MVRVRVPGGQTTGAALRELSRLAETYGSGLLQLTSRGERAGPRAAGGRARNRSRTPSAAAGFLPSAAHERVRNVVASPLTGLAGGRADLRPLVARLDRALLAEPRLAELPGRFLFVLDDGRGDVVGLGGDLGYRALDAGRGELLVGHRRRSGPSACVEAADALVDARAALPATAATDEWHVRQLDDPAGRGHRARAARGPRARRAPGVVGRPPRGRRAARAAEPGPGRRRARGRRRRPGGRDARGAASCCRTPPPARARWTRSAWSPSPTTPGAWSAPASASPWCAQRPRRHPDPRRAAGRRRRSRRRAPTSAAASGAAARPPDRTPTWSPRPGSTSPSSLARAAVSETAASGRPPGATPTCPTRPRSTATRSRRSAPRPTCRGCAPTSRSWPCG